MKPDSLTLTAWVVTRTGLGPPAVLRFATRAEAEARVAQGGATFSEIAEESHTYRVGDVVTVIAFNAERRGEVVSLGKTQVKVRYMSSPSRRTMRTSPFPSTRVWPRVHQTKSRQQEESTS